MNSQDRKMVVAGFVKLRGKWVFAGKIANTNRKRKHG